METCISKMVERYERGRISRRELIRRMAVLAAGARVAAASPAAGPPFKGIGINHVALDVTSVARSRDFCQKLPGAPVLRESASDCFLGLDKDFLTLFERKEARMDHYCIAIESFEVNAVTEELKRRGLNPDHPAGSNRVYFRDPDGLMVQLSSAEHRPG